MMSALRAAWLTDAPQDGPMNVALTAWSGTENSVARAVLTWALWVSVSRSVWTRTVSVPTWVTLTFVPARTLETASRARVS